MIDHVAAEWFLGLSAILFGIGFLGVLTQKNVIRILMSVELMFNAANINLILFASYSSSGSPDYSGWLLVFFTISIAAAEAAIGIAIFLVLSRSWGQVNVKDIFGLRSDHPQEIH